jgi:hypothetical protein
VIPLEDSSSSGRIASLLEETLMAKDRWIRISGKTACLLLRTERLTRISSYTTVNCVFPFHLCCFKLLLYSIFNDMEFDNIDKKVLYKVMMDINPGRKHSRRDLRKPNY